MARFSGEQLGLIQQMARAIREHWYWQNLWVFIDTEAEIGSFRRYRGPKGHLDPHKAKEDSFGRTLLALKAAFKVEAKRAWLQFSEYETRAEELGIPDEVVSALVFHAGRGKRTRPSLEKILTFIQPEISRTRAIATLRNAIRNADSLMSQREINILQKYADNLKPHSIDEYQPPKRVKDYAKIRRHWGRMYK